MSKLYKAITFILWGCTVVAILWFFSNCAFGLIDPLDRHYFESQQWKSADVEKRASMSRDVIRKIRAGTTETEVNALLGNPGEIIRNDSWKRTLIRSGVHETYSYDLGGWPLFAFDATYLWVHFDGQKKVLYTEINGY